MGHNRRLKPICAACGDPYSPKRANAGYHLCMPCGDGEARKQRASWCVLTPHKQGAMFFTAESAPELARGINTKYTPV
jgi:hypothetical protein